MKKLTLFLLLLSLFNILNAQEETKQNHFIIGGSLNFLLQNNTYPLSSVSTISGIGGIYSNGINDTKNTSISISPYVGKELNNHLLLGIQLDYRLGKYKTDDAYLFGQTNPVDYERRSYQIGIGVFSRHILNPEKRINFYIQPYFEYNLLHEENFQNSNSTQEEKVNYIELGLSAGILFNINDRWRATLRIGGLSYVNGKWEIVDTSTKKNFSSFGTNLNFASFYLGFEMKL